MDKEKHTISINELIAHGAVLMYKSDCNPIPLEYLVYEVSPEDTAKVMDAFIKGDDITVNATPRDKRDFNLEGRKINDLEDLEKDER